MPYWREYRNDKNEYVPYKEAEAQAKEVGKQVSELFTIVEVLEETFPENYSFSAKGNFRGNAVSYRSEAENREVSFDELVDSFGSEIKIRKKK